MENSGSIFDRALIALDHIDRRIIYLFVLFSLTIPLVKGIKLDPAPFETANSFFETIATFDKSKGKIALIASDWGPNTKAENQAQMEVAIEHLMREKIPFALTSLSVFSKPFLEKIPNKIANRLNEEGGPYTWKYGVDWVNIGYRPNGSIMIQSLAKSKDLKKFWIADAKSTPLKNIKMLEDVRTIKDIGLLLEFTGSVGAFDAWVEYFSVDGYKPKFLHGCTSITIPEARTYMASGQLDGLHEGLAGSAYYEKLLSNSYPDREIGQAWKMNTGLAFAQAIIICFILLGNTRIILNSISNLIGNSLKIFTTDND